MIWHYTLAGSDIVRDGVIKAAANTVFEDLFITRKTRSHLLDAVVWFTTRPTLEPTVEFKGRYEGVTPDTPGIYWRFAVSPAVAPQDLVEWAEERNYPPQWFKAMVVTAKLAGSDYDDWRLAVVDVPRSSWLAVERLYDGVWKEVTDAKK